jgi:hypothetical protein
MELKIWSYSLPFSSVKIQKMREERVFYVERARVTAYCVCNNNKMPFTAQAKTQEIYFQATNHRLPTRSCCVLWCCHLQNKATGRGRM